MRIMPEPTDRMSNYKGFVKNYCKDGNVERQEGQFEFWLNLQACAPYDGIIAVRGDSLGLVANFTLSLKNSIREFF